MKNKIVRNVVLGTTALLGVGYIIKRMTRRDGWKEAVEVEKIVENPIENDELQNPTNEPVYHKLGLAVKENDSVKVKSIGELTENTRKAI